MEEGKGVVLKEFQKLSDIPIWQVKGGKIKVLLLIKAKKSELASQVFVFGTASQKEK
jgi:hypothetical protein